MSIKKGNKKPDKRSRMISLLLVLVLLVTSVVPVGAVSFGENGWPVEEEAAGDQDSVQGNGTESAEPEVPSEEPEVTYELSFYDPEGLQKYTDLTMEVAEGETVVLPELPQVEERLALGWSTYASDTLAEYEQGEEVTVTQDMDLYAVYEQEQPEEPDKKKVTVQFFDEDGEQEYSEFAMTVEEGTQITMPSPEKRSNMRAMGWSTAMNASSAKHKVGTKLTVTEDLKLYSVHQKLYTVTFLTNTGKSTSRLQALKIQGVWKEKVTLPDLPVYSGYISQGWTNKKSGKTVVYKEGASYTIVGNRTLYQLNKKAATYTVKFYNNDGSSSTSLNKLAKKVQEGNTVTLPNLPAKSGYDRLGWTTSKKATKARYQSGDKLKVTRNLKLYAVYQKITYCTVQFYNSKGQAYSSLKKTVKKGTYVTLPSLPTVLGYRVVGWGKTKNASSSQTLDEQQRVRVDANLKLYSRYKKSGSTLRFYSQDGSREYTSFRMENEYSSAVMPTGFSPKGYTFLGWSTKKNQSEYPEYDMGQKYTGLKGTIKLYMVCKKKTTIESENAKMSVEVSEKYDQVFMIGDSRYHGAQLALDQRYGGVPENVTFLCESGRGLQWFQNNYTTGRNFLKEISKTPGKKAVIWNLGINDLIDGFNLVDSEVSKYTKTMISMAKDLAGLDCDLYFMSVNPANDKETASASYGDTYLPRTPYDIRHFNWKVRNAVAGYYEYIDTYSYLVDTGFTTYDGMHYGDSTYLKIYNKSIEAIDGR